MYIKLRRVNRSDIKFVIPAKAGAHLPNGKMGSRLHGNDNYKKPSIAGFTLLEILISLFIFTMLSLMLSNGLRLVMNAVSGTEISSERLRDTQRILLMLSRDIEQTVNRPILIASGKEEAAFVGTPRSFTFTHMRAITPDAMQTVSGLQRVRYFWDKTNLWKQTWAVVDQALESKPHSRALLQNIDAARFEYLDESGRLQNNWPLENSKQQLPKAIKISLTIRDFGVLTQLYVIAAQTSKPQQTQSE